MVAICLPTALVNGVQSTAVQNCLRNNSAATGPNALPQQCFNILAQANLGPQSTAADAQPYFNCLAQAGYRLPSSSSGGALSDPHTFARCTTWLEKALLSLIFCLVISNGMMAR